MVEGESIQHKRVILSIHFKDFVVIREDAKPFYQSVQAPLLQNHFKPPLLGNPGSWKQRLSGRTLARKSGDSLCFTHDTKSVKNVTNNLI